MSKIKTIIVDRGHGSINRKGEYTTAPNKMFTFPNGEVAYEGYINSQITLQLGDFIKGLKDVNLVYTVDPNDPTDISLKKRVSIANKYKTKETLFISIHSNAGGGEGFEIFTSKGKTNSDILAEFIADEVETLHKKFGLRLRYDLSDGDKDKDSDFYVLRKTKGISVLIECGFFDNPRDFKLLMDPYFQCNMAEKIFKGIVKYIDYVGKK